MKTKTTFKTEGEKTEQNFMNNDSKKLLKLRSAFC